MMTINCGNIKLVHACTHFWNFEKRIICIWIRAFVLHPNFVPLLSSKQEWVLSSRVRQKSGFRKWIWIRIWVCAFSKCRSLIGARGNELGLELKVRRFSLRYASRVPFCSLLYTKYLSSLKSFYDLDFTLEGSLTREFYSSEIQMFHQNKAKSWKLDFFEKI